MNKIGGRIVGGCVFPMFHRDVLSRRFRRSCVAAGVTTVLLATLAIGGVLAQEGESESQKQRLPAWDAAEPCENYSHPYQADLCQKWRQSEAAEKTAAAAERMTRLTRLQVVLAAGAILLLLLALLILLALALAARKAARALNAARRQEESELRAYVDVDKLEFVDSPETDGVVKVKVVFKNSGQTPAFNSRSAAQVNVREVTNGAAIPFMPPPEGAADSATPRLGRDATSASIVKCETTRNIADRITSGEAVILVWGWTEYVDIFDRERKTAFQYLSDAEALKSGLIFKPMSRAGDAT